MNVGGKGKSAAESIVTLNQSAASEADARAAFFDHFRACPIPEVELLDNLALFMRRQTMARLLFFAELYRRIIDVHGVMMEFGCRWGQNLSWFQSLRGMYEPYNYTRRIIGFDSFSGFPSVHERDGATEIVKPGNYGVTEGYYNYLDRVLTYHEGESPIGHMKKYELVAGDACETVPAYLVAHPETIIAFAYFDFDLYAPTKACLEAILPHVTKGTVLGFDELNFPEFPGETVALQEVLGLGRYRIQRSPLCPGPSFIVIE